MTETSIAAISPPSALARRVAITLLLLAVSRIPDAIPLPGVDLTRLRLDRWDMAPLTEISLGALGMTAYICAWIFMLLIQACMPSGRFAGARLEHAIRYLALVLALIQGFVVGVSLQHTDLIGKGDTIPIVTALTLAASVLLLTWLGDMITRYRIGPGMPLIIVTRLLAPLPNHAWFTFESWHLGAMTDRELAGLLAAIVATVLATVFVARARYRLPIGPVGDEGGRPLFLTLTPAGIVAPLCVMTAGYALDRMALTLIRFLDPHFSGSRLVVFVVGMLVFLMAMNVFGPLMRDPAALADAVQRGGGELTSAQIRRLTVVLGAVGGALLALFVELPDIVAQELQRLRSPISGSQLIIVALVMLACLERVEAEER